VSKNEPVLISALVVPPFSTNTYTFFKKILSPFFSLRRLNLPWMHYPKLLYCIMLMESIKMQNSQYKMHIWLVAKLGEQHIDFFFQKIVLFFVVIPRGPNWLHFGNIENGKKERIENESLGYKCTETIMYSM